MNIPVNVTSVSGATVIRVRSIISAFGLLGDPRVIVLVANKIRVFRATSATSY